MLGYNPLLWCWPRQGVPGTGLHYPVGGGLGKPYSRPNQKRKARESDYEDSWSDEEYSSEGEREV